MYYVVGELRISGAGSIRSADQHNGEWWRGDRWTPASDEACQYDTRADAQSIADNLSRTATVYCIDEDD